MNVCTWAMAAAGLAVAGTLPGKALAQSAGNAAGPGPEEQATVSDEIIVTGTLLRGEPLIGSSSISLDSTKLQETAALSSNELLATIPQVTNYFNNVPLADLAIAVNQIQISRPNLREISPETAASSATLILVDGHRIASAGVNQASIDPDLIPIGAIERVEVVTEGGSATYGADAVAGTINFITRKRFDGVKVDGHYGFADNYWQWDANATAGKDWGSGSAYVAYSYSKSDALYGRERSFIKDVNYGAEPPYVPRDLTCANPNLSVNTVIPIFGATVNSVNYAAPDFQPGTQNLCDNSQDETYIPRAERHGVLAGLTQELDSKTSIDIRAYYGQRKTQSTGDLTSSVAVTPANPYAATSLPAGLVLGPTTVGPYAAVNLANVSFNLRPLLGPDSKHSDTLIKEWGFNAELKHDLNSNWQLRTLFNWSASDSSYELTGISNSRLGAAGAATTADTAFNPFDVTNNNPALVADLIDSEIAGQAKDDLFNARAILEGKLLDLPGGDARLAIGYEYMHDSLSQRFGSDIRIGTLSAIPFSTYSRNVHSVFGELQAPLLSDGYGGSMLTVSASARYDKYSDFGDTFNPKFGATFKPAEWISLRGNWGTSFTAPTPLDQLGSSRNTIGAFPFVPFPNPADPAPPGAYTVGLQGSVSGLKPQKADTWSVGADLTPIDGLSASVSYYDVNFKDILRTPKVDADIIANYPDNVLTNSAGFSAADLLAFAAQAPGGTATVQPLIDSGTLVYELVDFRVANYGILHVKGIDFQASYNHPTSFGSVDLAVSGNRPLSRKSQVSPEASVVDELATEHPKLYLQSSLGASIGSFRAQASWNYTGGYDIVPTGTPVQDHVSSFSTVNLFFKYDVPASSAILKDLTLTLNVNNVFDQDPPVLRRNLPNEFGFANGFSFGRMFILGASKKF
ncbi:TonB-dependent receptor domain-containing protein [Novosphingobium beihaiensis]|uniref:TonB-dependent receptor n=1 Tax=Novosphingobium beihaiensis TaxID=2930389 RepID=A0ABT0BLD8_9SPHN|nr:TonB-dependent receptor [Novosphingobium beihaiensis]MCJ2185876.1 TonB-dependent receptor [Novosphingobium beihaiensis]